MKFMKFIIMFLLVMGAGMIIAYSEFGAPTEFGNDTTTTCWVGGDDGIVNCTGNISGAYLFGDGSELTGLAGGGDINAVNTNGPYLSGGADSGAVSLLMNETYLNISIDARATGLGDNESFNQSLTNTLYSNDTWVDSFFVRFTELVAQVGNYSAWDKAYSDLIGTPTVLSNFTDDLGDRGYTSTLNFSNDLSWINTSGETDPLSIHRDGNTPLSANWAQGAFNFTSTTSWFLGKVAWATIQDKFITAVDDVYLYMSGTTATLNTTKLNESIEAYGYSTESGDITNVIAGTGLLNGGDTGDVTLNVSADTCGAGNISKYNGTHFNCVVDAGGTDTNASTACATSEVLLGNGTCVDSDNFYDDTDTTIGNCSVDQSCANVLYTTDEYIGGLSCADTKIAKWNDTSSAWYCADDEVGEPGAGDIEGVNTNGKYLTGGCSTGTCSLLANESEFNATMDLRDDDTTYTAGSNITLTGTQFNWSSTWVDTLFPQITELVGLVGNWSADKSSYTLTSGLVAILGNWSADKSDYYTSTETDTEIENANTSMKTYVDSNPGGYSTTTGTVTSVATDDSYLTGGAITSTGTITLNTTLAGTSLATNTSDYWDNLGSPSDIGTGDITDDGTWRLDSWDNFTGIPVATPSDADTTHISTADQIFDYIAGLSYLDAEVDPVFTAWDNFTGIPHAAPSDNDVTHFSYANDIYDWVIGLAYATDAKVDSLGNWSADKSSYWDTSGDLDDVIATDEITELKIDFNTACAAGNHLYVSGNNLACEADDDTTYTAGDNLDLIGTVFSLDADVNITTLNVSTHFIIDTVNITCFNPACDLYMNATDSCQYWPSGGKTCGA